MTNNYNMEIYYSNGDSDRIDNISLKTVFIIIAGLYQEVKENKASYVITQDGQVIKRSGNN